MPHNKQPNPGRIEFSPVEKREKPIKFELTFAEFIALIHLIREGDLDIDKINELTKELDAGSKELDKAITNANKEK